MTSTPSRSHLRAKILIGALAGSAVLSASAASAASAAGAPGAEGDEHRVVHRDARADVLLFPEGSETGKPAPGDRATDVIKTVVDHQTDQVVVQARVRQLSRSGYRLLIAEVLASGGKRYQLLVDYSTTPISSRVSLTRYASGAEVSCSGASWSVDRSTNRVEGSVPTSCLGGPDWVRVGVGVVSAPQSLTTSSADDSRTKGRVGDDHLELGPVQPHA